MGRASVGKPEWRERSSPIPANAIGTQLYNAKVYLETGDLFAWTAVIILLSMAPGTVRRMAAGPGSEAAPFTEGGKRVLKLQNISFSYQNMPVLRQLSLNLASGDRIAIMGTLRQREKPPFST